MILATRESASAMTWVGWVNTCDLVNQRQVSYSSDDMECSGAHYIPAETRATLYFPACDNKEVNDDREQTVWPHVHSMGPTQQGWGTDIEGPCTQLLRGLQFVCMHEVSITSRVLCIFRSLRWLWNLTQLRHNYSSKTETWVPKQTRP